MANDAQPSSHRHPNTGHGCHASDPLAPLAQVTRIHDYQEAVRRTDRELGANRVQRVVGMLRPTLPFMDHRRLGHRTQLAHKGARRPNEA